MKKTITDDDFAVAARLIGCDVPAIKAVCEVESPRGGFNPDGTLTTLFEAHKFHEFTEGKFTASHPHLSSRTWNKALYGSDWEAERARLAEAAKLDPVQAIRATSWGRFQIMGFNHEAAGYDDGADMVNDFAKGEDRQLVGFVHLILDWGLGHTLRVKDFKKFALRYNGPRADENRYPQKIAAAYRKHGGTL